MQLNSFRIMHHRNIGMVETVCFMATLNAHIVLSRPLCAKPPSHGYSMQEKAPPHDMREDFAIASEGIARPARYPLGSI